jgi:hypothetical protein
MKTGLTWLFALYIFGSWNSPTWAEPPEQTACLKLLSPLHHDRDRVADLDGIWGLFQKTSEFQKYSVQGISLDNRINSMLFNLEYLCMTINGIPLDELSDYVSSGLKEKGAENFRKELLILGKSDGEIDVWFKFSKFSTANLHRPLEPNKISSTIQLSQPLIKQYLELAEGINRKENMASVIHKAQQLTNKIESFFKTDPYISQAIYENSQVPYADWDEDVGGS